MTKHYFLVCSLFAVNLLYSQEVKTDNAEQIVSNRLEIIAMTKEEEDFDFTFFTERLTFYFQNPITLDNKCESSLKELQLLSDIQINEILNHVSQFGPIYKVEELQQISSLHVEDILNIAPFIKTENNSLNSLNTIDKAANHHVRIRYKEMLQNSRGYKDSKYLGPNYLLYSRYSFKFDKSYSAGITLEKDPGEVFSHKNQYSDFKSAYICYESNRKIRKIMLGDFTAGFGQGLTFSSNGGLSKSAEVLLIGRSFDAVRPYRSVNESGFLRGIVGEFALGRLMIRSFISSLKQDATIKITPTGRVFSSLHTSGLHRTDNEVSKINTLNTNTIGVASNYLLSHGEIGFIAVRRVFSLAGEQKNELHNSHLKNEKNTTCLGWHYRYTKDNLTSFSEVSHSMSTGFAAVFGLLFMPDKRIGISFLARHYDHDYSPIASVGFGERSRPQNEEGLYSGIRLGLSKRISLSAFADIFSFNHPTFQSVTGGQGLDYFLELKRRMGKDNEYLVQVKWKEKPRDANEQGLILSRPSKEINKKIRFQYQCYLLEALRFRSRIEFSEYLYHTISEQGLLMFQELKYSKLGMKWSILCRYTLFDTEGYQSRIYTYEQNVQGAYSIPSFSGKGSKIIALLNYKLKKGFKFSVKLSQLIYDNRTSIGSGLDEIEGQEKTEITVQIDIGF